MGDDFVGVEEALNFNGGHAAGTRRGDCLTVAAVLNVARVKDAFYIRSRPAMGNRSPSGSRSSWPTEWLCVGNVPNGDEDPVHIAHPRSAGFHVTQYYAGNVTLADIQDVLDHRVREEHDLRDSRERGPA